ncbi:ComF family protein [Hydrotalea flava]|uniref:ComF family protein n=1 Tax=Hydrotalea flava TaxID=714549 RepID=UPI00082DE304|nr:ComF family protein [Hydrotalea flava]
MMQSIQNYWHSFSRLFFPHLCEGCGTDILSDDVLLCPHCFLQLPTTGFFSAPDNPVEQSFYGRVPVAAAAAAFYFTKHSLLQHLLFQLKYKGHQKLGIWLGEQVGSQLATSNRFQPIDIIVPLPLHPKKEKLRGYNQAACIGQGISSIVHKPLVTNAITRAKHTQTQTQKNRSERWQNMEDAFTVLLPEVLQHQHVLLVDDVITTGATLEACSAVLLSVPVASVRIATVAYTIL